MQCSEVVNRIVRGENDDNSTDRTVLVSPISSIAIDEVRTYFQQFGALDDIWPHTKESCFVRFQSITDASTVLSFDSHKIGDRDIDVKAADLLMLNDHVLRQILEYLDEKDLVNAAMVSTRFQSLATLVFEKKHSTTVPNNTWEPAELSSLLTNFGSKITGLDVNGNDFGSANEFLCEASEYCTALRDLTLANLHISGMQLAEKFNMSGIQLAEKLRPLFARLETLQLEKCTLKDGAETLFDACKNLKTLAMDKVNIANGKCIQKEFKMLEQVEFKGNRRLGGAIINFIKLNPTLKQLYVKETRVKLSKLIQVVVDNLPNLIELSIIEDSSETAHLANLFAVQGQLSSLKSLELYFNGVPVQPLMNALAANNVPIEELFLHFGEIDIAAINSISKLIRIEALTFIGVSGLKDAHLIRLTRALPKLQMLWLGVIGSGFTTVGLRKMLNHTNVPPDIRLYRVGSMVINEDDYNALLGMLQSRKEKCTLRVTLKRSQVTIPDDVLAKNRNIIQIDYCSNFLI